MDNSTSRRKKIISAIGYIETPFDEKFAVPRQSALVHHGNFRIKFYAPYDTEQAFIGIDEFSHLWVMFDFSLTKESDTFAPMVRPPRLGGNKSIGVFATRSPFRPNNIGLSLVKLLRVENNAGHISLIIEGADMVNGTPIIDIKPYIELMDKADNPRCGFASTPIDFKEVKFSEQAKLRLQDLKINDYEALITEVLSQDPRPAYKQKGQDLDKVYGVSLLGHNVTWQMTLKDEIYVLNIE